MTDLIDIHTHILPEVDDGSNNIIESLNMLRQSKENGVSKVVLTPHYISKSKYKSASDVNLDIFKKLMNRVLDEKIDIEIILANEIYASNTIVDMVESKIVLPIGDTNFVLLETSRMRENVNVEEIIYELCLFGYTPIIAHPEEYEYIENFEDTVSNWIDNGALIQVNKMSLIGCNKKYRKRVDKLIKYKLVHFIASDCHNLETRKPGLIDVYNYVSRKYGVNIANQLLRENQKRIFENQSNLKLFKLNDDVVNKKILLIKYMKHKISSLINK